MADSDYEDEQYEQELASPEQKLEIATYFIMSSPVGEIDFVVADTKKLTNSEQEILTKDRLRGIMKNYNLEQMTSALYKGKRCVVSSHGMVRDDQFVNPRLGIVLNFDHVKRSFTGEVNADYKLPDDIEAQRAAIEKQIDTYVETKYVTGSSGTVYADHEKGVYTICISATKAKISSFWTGAWQATYVWSIKEKKENFRGSIKVQVHYFEDGNVQFHGAIEKKQHINPEQNHGDNASTIKTAIYNIEDKYNEALVNMYEKMHKETFKSMRRFLPITRQPMTWNILAHGIGQ